MATGWNEDGQCNVGEWNRIKAVAAGFNFTVGLRDDGTVVAVGNNECGQCNVTEWRNIIEIVARVNSTIGLRADGTLVTTDEVLLTDDHDISQWKYIASPALITM